MSMAPALAPAPAPAPCRPPWLKDPRKTVFQIEAFVVAAAVLLFFQLIFGFCRRHSRNKLIQCGLSVSYTLSFPLITYTLGMMQSSPVKSSMYPVWALSLFLVSGCSNSITVYHLDDNKQWKKHLFEFFQYYIYVSLIIAVAIVHASPGAELSLTSSISLATKLGFFGFLCVMVYCTNLLRVIACWMVSSSDSSKAVADYMRDLQAGSRSLRQPQVEGCPVRIGDYKYLVRWYGHTLITHGARVPNYRNKLRTAGLVTIDMIWEKCNDMLLDPNGASQLKDVCLSFALFHLLKRRFFGMHCDEAGLQETRDFVLRGLLSENGDDYARAFRIIEVELSFLHDFLFTKYASIYENDYLFYFSSLTRIIFTVIIGVLVNRNSLILRTTTDPIIEVDTKTIDTRITLVILGALLILDILQIFLYLASDWALVSLACTYVRYGLRRRVAILRKAIWKLRKLNLFKYWQNKIGQYSVIEGCCWYEFPLQDLERRGRLAFFLLTYLDFFVCETVWGILACRRSIVQFVRLPDIVKREIASSLNSTSNGHLTNGEASLRRNISANVLPRFSCMLNREDRNQTDTMLIWHIGTEYCEIALPRLARRGPNSVFDKEYREVATKLSRYCAYLMAFLPELLPGNYADTKFTFDKVMKEAAEALQDHKVERGRLLQAINGSRSDNENDTIYIKGLKLGRKLEESIHDSILPWKVMAEFWAETILYVAPSNNFSGHIEQLANGGEFLTHVWALLSHAGILTRPEKEESQHNA